MTAAENIPILVGVDGSEPSVAAARWAAVEARLRHRPLLLVHAYTWPVVPSALPGAPLGRSEETVRKEAEAMVAVAVAAVAADAGEVSVAGQAVRGAAVTVLVEASAGACLVVVGHRGRGGLTALLLGSVAAGVAAHAHGPVVVVRQAPDATPLTGPVVVGVDGSPPTDAAVGFGFEEADRRGLALTVAYALTVPWRGPVRPLSDDVAELETAELHRMRGWVNVWQEKFPHVPVTYRLVAAHPAAALIDLSRDATLLVVGSRGRGGFARLLLGSVSQQVLHHAHCPIAVVR